MEPSAARAKAAARRPTPAAATRRHASPRADSARQRSPRRAPTRVRAVCWLARASSQCATRAAASRTTASRTGATEGGGATRRRTTASDHRGAVREKFFSLLSADCTRRLSRELRIIDSKECRCELPRRREGRHLPLRSDAELGGCVEPLLLRCAPSPWDGLRSVVATSARRGRPNGSRPRRQRSAHRPGSSERRRLPGCPSANAHGVLLGAHAAERRPPRPGNARRA